MIFGDAASDIRYLLDRGYPQNGAVSFVCNHYRLDEESRHLLSRGVLSRAVSGKRKMKFLPCDKIKGNNIIIDGYNIIIGMESILEKKAFICDDGVIRDIKGVFRNFKTSENTGKAIGFILQFLNEKRPSHVYFLLDSQVSESGLLAKTLREKMADSGLKGDAMTSKHVDYDLKHSDDIVASSDGVIIDAAGKVVNFLYCMISGFPRLEAGVGKINEFQGQVE
ncbi:MAG: DUF434 domain-containing protein [Candidatus Methanoperedens sp.]|nr:DUF434 domain-containing protein [Candidatus Methanoperedens sp.]MCZ7403822.1 DUF434 domain-containing protein [Candidatus Methanoperedens sp.]